MKTEGQRRNDFRAQRKCKIVAVGEYVLMDILSNAQQGDVFMWATYPGGMPGDAVILNVAHNYDRGCWDLLIGSESFPAVPAGASYECIPLDVGSIRYRSMNDVIQAVVDRGDSIASEERSREDLRNSAMAPIAHFSALQGFSADGRSYREVMEERQREARLAFNVPLSVLGNPYEAYESAQDDGKAVVADFPASDCERVTDAHAEANKSWRDREPLL